MANPTQEERSRTGGSKSPHALGRKGLLQWAGVTRADMHLAPWPPRGGVKDTGTAGWACSCADGGAAGTSAVLGVVVSHLTHLGGRALNAGVQGWQFWTPHDLF